MFLKKYKNYFLFIVSFSIYYLIFPYIFTDPLIYIMRNILFWIFLPERIRYEAFIAPFYVLFDSFLPVCISWGIYCGLFCFLLKIRYSGFYILLVLFLVWLYIETFVAQPIWRLWYSIIGDTIVLCGLIFSAYISEVMCNFTIRVISRVSKLIKRRDDVNK